MSEELSVQRVAKNTGLSAHTLRYYERIGLMAPISRAPNGHRRYTEHDLEWIILLVRLRSTGMPISEMQRFADLVWRGESTIPDRRELLEAHERRLSEQRQEIEQTLAVLAEKLVHYRASARAGPEERFAEYGPRVDGHRTRCDGKPTNERS